jgi:short subunit dehydrogenase-like uncharacterized protein
VAEGPIAVYGASGYTGRLVVRELARRGLDGVLTGRDSGRLHEAAEAAGVDFPVRAAALDDRAALRHVLGDCAVVISCAGPFTRYGEPVVRAALETGTHYADTSGEQRWIRRVYEHHDEAARAAEVAAIPAVGFDYLPGDLACRLAARDVEPAREVVVAYWVEGFGATRGTLRSALEAMRERPLEYRDGRWVESGPAPARARFRFPDPVGEQAMTRFPSGEVVTVPRHTRVGAVRSLMATRPLAPVGVLAGALPLALPALALTLHSPLKPLLDLAIGRLPEGPSEEARRRARFQVVALACGEEDGRNGCAVVRGGDVYGLTAVIAVHAASLLAGAGFDAAGALAPAEAFDPVEFLNYLGDHGVSYTVDAPTREPAA